MPPPMFAATFHLCTERYKLDVIFLCLQLWIWNMESGREGCEGVVGRRVAGRSGPPPKTNGYDF